MKVPLILLGLMVSISIPFSVSYAVSSFVPSTAGRLASGFLQVCPDTTVSLTCSHDSVVDLTRWRVTPRLPMDCNTAITHTASPNTSGMCGPFSISMIGANSEPTRVSTLELVVTESLNGAVVTCYAGATVLDPVVGSFTIQIIGPPSLPTIDNMEYSVIDPTTGQVTLLAISAGTFGTNVSFYASIEGIGPVVMSDNNNIIIVTGLSYTESHTVSVVATSAVCPGVLNSSTTGVPVVFNITTPVLTRPTGFVDCSNPSLPISGSWSLMEGVQSSSDLAVQLTPPPNDTPTITYTSARGRSGSAVFVPGSSYQLTDTVENDAYTFTVTVINVAGSSSEMSAKIEVTPFIIVESTLGTMNCITFSLGQNCMSEESGDFAILFQQVSGVCQNVRLSDLNTSKVLLTSQSTCAPVVLPTDLCYRATLTYNGMVIDTQTNLDFSACTVTVLESFLAYGVSYQFDVEATNGNVSHLTTATLSCTETFASVSGAAVVTCVDGQWNNISIRWCSRSCAVPIALTFVFTVFVGVFVTAVMTSALVYTCRKSKKTLLHAETGMIPPPPVIYEEPDDIKPKAHTMENPAYGHVQFS